MLKVLMILLALMCFCNQPAYSAIKDFEWLEKENAVLPDEFHPWDKLEAKHNAIDEESFRSGLALQNQKKFDEAAKVYSKLVEHSPNEYVVWYDLGLCLEQSGDYDKATEALKTCTHLKTSVPAAHKHLANCYMKKAQQDLQSAQAHWETYKTY